MNGFLLDTCAISELIRKAPNRGFTEWLRTIPEESTFLSALTIGELTYAGVSMTAYFPSTGMRRIAGDACRLVSSAPEKPLQSATES